MIILKANFKNFLKKEKLLLVQLISVFLLYTASNISHAENVKSTKNIQLSNKLNVQPHFRNTSPVNPPILLPIYNNEPISIVNNLATQTDNKIPPIVAFADNSCGGKLSIVKYSSPAITIDGALQYAYIGQCISNVPVHNIILRNNFNTLYVSYLDNSNQIHLMQQRFGSNSWNDYPYSEQLQNRNPTNIDMVVNSRGLPIIVYTNNPEGKNYQQIYVLKYNGNGFDLLSSNDQVVTRGQIRVGLDSNDNLYVAYLDWNFCPGIIKFFADGSGWNYLNSDFGNLFHNWLRDNPDAFDMLIQQQKNRHGHNDTLYLLMSRDRNVPGITHMDVYTSDIDGTHPELTKSDLNIRSLDSLHDGMIKPRLHLDGSGNIYLSYINDHRVCTVIDGEPVCTEKFASRVTRFINAEYEINKSTYDISEGNNAITGFIGVNQTSNPAYYRDFFGYHLVKAQTGLYKMFPISPK